MHYPIALSYDNTFRGFGGDIVFRYRFNFLKHKYTTIFLVTKLII
jgi:hypothetical protein